MKTKRRKKHPPFGRTVLLLLLAAAVLLPTLLTIAGSFMPQEELTRHYGAVFDSLGANGTYIEQEVHLQLLSEDFTLQQYFTVLLQSPDYLLKFWGSVFLVAPIVLGQVAVASMAAYSLMRVRSRIRSVVFFFYVLLMLLPYQVTLVPNYLVAKWLGVLGTRWAVIFPGVFAPFSVFLLARFMQRIPRVQIEAAQLDGAGEWRIFTRICLPQCRGILYSVAILVFLDYWNMVEQPLVLLSDPDQYPLSVFLAQVNTQDVAIAFAAAVVYMLPPLLLFLHGEPYLVAGIAQTAVGAGGKETVPHRRRWVVAAAAVFLAGMGFLAFFLKPLTDRFVPRVTGEAVVTGELLGQPFDQVVSSDALLQDEDGDYLLVIHWRESAFGERYQVERVPVKVLAYDGEHTAVKGELSYLEPVVTAYSFLPRDGEYVQLSGDGGTAG